MLKPSAKDLIVVKTKYQQIYCQSGTFIKVEDSVFEIVRDLWEYYARRVAEDERKEYHDVDMESLIADATVYDFPSEQIVAFVKDLNMKDSLNYLIDIYGDGTE